MPAASPPTGRLSSSSVVLPGVFAQADGGGACFSCGLNIHRQQAGLPRGFSSNPTLEPDVLPSTAVDSGAVSWEDTG